MTRKTLGRDGLPRPLKQKLANVGQQIKLARKRRRMTMKEMAKRMFVTRKTISRLESGDPGVSFGVLGAALLVLGLENDLDHLAQPESDTVGNLIDRRGHERKQRVQPSRDTVNLDF
jgi:transcriptional regulator with XRE-family HTH domain